MGLGCPAGPTFASCWASGPTSALPCSQSGCEVHPRRRRRLRFGRRRRTDHAGQAPNANAYAERWIRTVRAECLDWLLITGRGHLEQVLRIDVEHYNGHRPHRALGLESPDAPTDPSRHQRQPAPCAPTRPAQRSAPRVPPTSCMNEFLRPTGVLRAWSLWITVCSGRGLRLWMAMPRALVTNGVA